MSTKSYSGRYFRTAFGDIKGSKGWFGKLCLLGLISFIPIFGQMTLSGYAYEWAHKAAWGVESPMPKKIYGREGSKMLRWGWFALVITFVISLVPSIVSSIGSALSSAGAGEGFYTAAGHYMTISQGNPFFTGLGWLVGVASIVLFVFACLFIWAGTMRMTMYDRLSTGFQIGKVWEMIKRDFGGIMRIFGMALLFWVVGSIIATVVVICIVMIVISMTVAPMAMMYQGGVYYYEDTLLMYLIGIFFMMLPLFLIIAYICLVYTSFVELLIARAMGYWMRQFNVSAWGSKDDPLPAPTVSQAGAQPQPPVAPPSPSASAAPAPPTGEPVIEADVPVAAAVVTETVVTDAEGDVVADVEEADVVLEPEETSENEGSDAK